MNLHSNSRVGLRCSFTRHKCYDFTEKNKINGSRFFTFKIFSAKFYAQFGHLLVRVLLWENESPYGNRWATDLSRCSHSCLMWQFAFHLFFWLLSYIAYDKVPFSPDMVMAFLNGIKYINISWLHGSPLEIDMDWKMEKWLPLPFTGRNEPSVAEELLEEVPPASNPTKPNIPQLDLHSFGLTSRHCMASKMQISQR